MATEKVTVPDFGDVQDITVVEVYVSAGDTVEVEDALIALESEKAVMDIPSTVAGTVKEVYLKEDDSVNSGDAIILVELSDSADEPAREAGESAEQQEKETTADTETAVTEADSSGEEERISQPPDDKDESSAPETVEAAEAAGDDEPSEEDDGEDSGEKAETYHATPSVRAYARELGVGLGDLVGTGPKGRIQKEDVIGHVKKAMSKGSAAGGTQVLPAGDPLEDFSKYGEVEEIALNRIKKVSGPHLHKSWVTIPHVTHFDEADATDLDEFRKQMNEEARDENIRFSPLIFIIKAVVATLKEFPHFNSSLDVAGNALVVKHFYNMGIAVDTPNGLVVPVIKDVEKKGMKEIAQELKTLSETAREGKLKVDALQGATFTISSLGGIGGTGFTPIINAPQVAILGLSRNYLKPVWSEAEGKFIPRLTLPFSLSYDHRVIDGADAARFCQALGRDIEDLRRALL